MIKIGIYIDTPSPEEGGATTLLKTIKDETGDDNFNKEKFSLIFIFRGSLFGSYKTTVDNFDYININAVKRIYYFSLLIRKIKDHLINVIRKLLFFNEKHDSISCLDIIAKREKIDLIWFTFPVMEKITCPYAFTIWDLGHRVLPAFPEVNDNWEMRERVVQSMIYHATYIFTGNERGKKEILENYCIPASKIEVIPFPISSFCYGEEKKPDFDIPQDYFFYPAQFWPHKNHITIIKAVEYLKHQKNIVIHVLFSGSDKGYQSQLQKKAELLGISDLIHFVGFVSAEEIKYLYTHAKGMIYASALGPNNLPPIEAAYLGCPIIISNLPGHIEQLGDAAEYFSCFDEKSLAQAIENVAFNKEIINRLKQNMKNIEFNESYLYSVFRVFSEFDKMAECWKQ